MTQEHLESVSVVVEVAKPEDAEGMLIAQKKAWLATYPNPALGITSEDILVKLGDYQEKVKKRREYLAKISGDPNIGYWVVKDGDQVVGFLYAKKGEENVIEALYITPESQNKGVGSSLMAEALNWFGDNPVTVVAVTYNQGAIRFYKRFGFVDNGSVRTDFGVLGDGKIMPETKMVRNPRNRF